jgi:peptide/nickel transport system substrate-binding protein
MKVRWFSRTFAAVAVAAMVAAACSSKTPAITPSSSGGATLKKGGSAVFGAEQWPQCLNIITSCGNSTWMQIVAPQPVLPKLLILDAKGNYAVSPLIKEVPSLENGGITQSPFTVTYHLTSNAVWDDKTPITSADVDFTWKAILHTTATYSTAGYDKITAIDTTDPQTVKIAFGTPFADWPDLFGGGGTNGYVLKKAAFPNANADKPDLKNEMNTIINFSGGPWKMQSWSKSQEVLVANRNYWGHQPILDQVTFVPFDGQPQEIASLLSGQVDAIFPQAGASSVIKQLQPNPNAKAVTGPTNYGDAFWFNLQDPVLKDFAVRQAIAYGVDRQKIIDQIIKLNDPNATVLNCIPPLFPVIGTWCDDAVKASTSKYSYNPQQALTILKADGYDCSKVPASPCTKNGVPLKITSLYTAGNTRRAAVGAIVQEGMKAAGIQWIPKPNDPTDIFTNKLVNLDYQSVEYAAGTVVDPSPTVSGAFLCNQIPTKANNHAGANTDAYCDPQLDPLMVQSDTLVDPVARHKLISQIYVKIQGDLVALPLYPFINITGWRADKIGGPIGQWNQAPFGTYWNMDYWGKV